MKIRNNEAHRENEKRLKFDVISTLHDLSQSQYVFTSHMTYLRETVRISSI